MTDICDVKHLELMDRGTKLKFTVTPLSCGNASKLIVQLSKVCVNDKTIDGALAQQSLHNAMRTGVVIEGIDKSKLEAWYKLTKDQQISNLFNAIVQGLNDDNHDIIINKFLTGVMYNNGSVTIPGQEAYANDMIKDYLVLYKLLREVFVITFWEGLVELGKLISPNTAEV